MQRSIHFLARSTVLHAFIAVVLISMQLGAGSALAATLSVRSLASQPQTCSNGKWQIINSPNAGTKNYWLTADAALSPSDVWVVGNDITPYTVLASSIGKPPPWNVINSQNDGYPTGMVAFSDTDIWIVGNPAHGQTPLIEHWDGTSLSVIPTSTPGGLSKASAVSPSDIWATGTLTMHYDGTQWSVVPMPVQGKLDGVAAITSNDVWAVGIAINNHALIEHWDGTQWSVAKSPVLLGYLHGVAVVSANDIWAVGDRYNNTPLIEHWNGKKWNVVTSPGSGILYNVAVVSKDNIWAVGGVSGATFIEHWDGTSWTKVSSPSIGHGAFLQGVVRVPGTKTLYAVGRYEVGTKGRQLRPLVEYFSC